MRSVRPETISRLRQVQAGGVENAKALARVVKALDDETHGMAARELREELNRQHNVDLREDKINRSRYIGRLLFALDPVNGEPSEIAEIDDAETLYLMQRLHEVKQVPHADILNAWVSYQQQELSTAQIRQRMKDAIARAQSRATSDRRAAWRQPLMKIPPETCDILNRRFASFAQAQEATQQQAAEALGEVLQMALNLLPLDTNERLNRDLLVWAETMDLGFEEGVSAICSLLEVMPPEHWKTLIQAVKGSQ